MLAKLAGQLGMVAQATRRAGRQRGVERHCAGRREHGMPGAVDPVAALGADLFLHRLRQQLADIVTIYRPHGGEGYREVDV